MKDKTVAALFALFLGWFGIHRFYLKQPGLGVLYIFLFFIFGVSIILGIIDALVLLAMDPKEFDRRYNDGEQPAEHDRYEQRPERRDFRRNSKNYQTRRENTKHTRSRSQATTPSSRARTRRPVGRRKINPYKQSGIKKHKDFDLEGAIEDFNRGLQITPEDMSLHFNIACSYSLTEQKTKAFYHLEQAVNNGFKDFDKIKTHDDLAFLRIQPEFAEFEQNGYRRKERQQLEAPKKSLLDDDLLLSQLNRLNELKNKGIITEEEFLAEKQKLMR